MQRRLTIEDHVVIVTEMPFDDIAKVEISIGKILSVG